MRLRSFFRAALTAVLLAALGATPVLACLSHGGDAGIASHAPQTGSGGGSTGPALEQGPEYDPVLAEMIAQVDESEIRRSVSELVARSTRVYPSAGNAQAAANLRDRLAAIPGLEVEYQSDTYRNVIATLPGNGGASNGIVIVGAHYDSKSSDPADAPGATDDAGGVAIVLELARVMSRYQFNHTIQFAFWNAEESGLAGSAAYVASAVADSLPVPLYLNYDSPCYDPNGRYVLDIISTTESRPFATLLAHDNSVYGINFDLTSNEHTCHSDHTSFRRGGYPAIATHSETHAPGVHSPSDTLDLVSFGYAKKNAQLGMLLLASTAGLRSRGSDRPAPVPSSPGAVVTVSPTPSSVAIPTVTPAGTPASTFGTRRYVIGTVPGTTPDGNGGSGTTRGHQVRAPRPAIGTGIATGTAPPAARFVRWSPLERWRPGRTG